MKRVRDLDKKTLSELGIFLVTILWGLTFPLIRMGVQNFDPLYFVFFRFGIAALAFLPIVFFVKSVRKGLRVAAGPGLTSGVVVSSVYIFQTIGLATVPSNRGAFVTSSYVILVPLLSPLFGRQRPLRGDWIAALTAMAGLYLILNPETTGISVGDVWILGCALTCSLSIHIVKLIVDKPYDLTALAFWQVVSVTLVALLCLPLRSNPVLIVDRTAVVTILINALGVTVLSTLVPIYAQRFMPPERTALIYAMEPVFAVIFGYFILGEVLTWASAAGGLLIILSIIGGPTLRLFLGRL